nr:MAG TPA: hypothetical protein [Caudoviricetes sp.]
MSSSTVTPSALATGASISSGKSRPLTSICEI